ncbi:hypothetical protein Aab01nite_69540 [Paractinoplanes abujensis]|uniref:Uncharacterized protein n=1 Tax=Paractinoplanes abujensis TaxID=882441 RepID=A0A7W7CWJ8_9ACTN|nr:hypothetical protein [Actinoplanes abujensis]MBB4695779.1 hypothetical protein [Actinoplanes abujensis]GID23364.1 hypothetical protein Aab01nite_69540 [Actinoplanes abujensis]
MTETGWPLIPREVLPAPVPAAKRPSAPRADPPPSEAGRQLPFFGAETIEPSPADLAGLLAGPGVLGRMGGTARVLVPVDAAWRVHVLVAELVIRGLVVNWRPLQDQDPSPVRDVVYAPLEDDAIPELDGDAEGPAQATKPEMSDEPTESVPDDEPVLDGRAEPETVSDEEEPEPPGPRFEVLTAYSRRLNGLAQAWPQAASQLFLSGPRLRLWVAAAGEPVPGGYALGLDPAKDVTEIDAALVRAGLAGRVSDDGRRYLIAGKRRVKRLAELVGERPAAAPESLWPGGAAA